MAINTAREELDKIKQDIKATPDAGATLSSIEPSNEVIQAPSTKAEKAKFGTADALLTGLITGVLAGPLVGVIVGAGFGIAQKKEEQKLLEKIAGRENAMTEGMDIQQERLNTLASEATTPSDKQQVSLLQGDYDLVKIYSSKNDPALQQLAYEGQLRLSEGIHAYVREKEVDDAERILKKEAIERDIGKQKSDNLNAMLQQFTDQTAPRLRSATAFLRLDAVLSGRLNPDGTREFPSSFDSHAGISLYLKTIDDLSAAREGEVKAAQSLGPAIERFRGFVSNLLEGEPITPKMVNQLMSTAARINFADQQIQDIIEANFLDRLIDGEYNLDKYADDFNFNSKIPNGTFTPWPELETPPNDRERDTEQTIENFKQIGRFITSAFEKNQQQAEGQASDIGEFVRNLLPLNREPGTRDHN